MTQHRKVQEVTNQSQGTVAGDLQSYIYDAVDMEETIVLTAHENMLLCCSQINDPPTRSGFRTGISRCYAEGKSQEG